jgi:hypothetical protein
VQEVYRVLVNWSGKSRHKVFPTFAEEYCLGKWNFSFNYSLIWLGIWNSSKKVLNKKQLFMVGNKLLLVAVAVFWKIRLFLLFSHVMWERIRMTEICVMRAARELLKAIQFIILRVFATVVNNWSYEEAQCLGKTSE